MMAGIPYVLYIQFMITSANRRDLYALDIRRRKGTKNAKLKCQPQGDTNNIHHNKYFIVCVPLKDGTI